MFYSEEVIIDQVIRGLANAEIQRDVLSHLDADKLTLDKLLTFIEGKESGEASQGLLANSTVGVSNAVILDKKNAAIAVTAINGEKSFVKRLILSVIVVKLDILPKFVDLKEKH